MAVPPRKKSCLSCDTNGYGACVCAFFALLTEHRPHTHVRVLSFFSFCLSGVSFSEYFFYHQSVLLLPFSLVNSIESTESSSYVLSFRMVIFYLVTTVCNFYISLLRENPINQSISINIHPCSADHEQD